MINIKIICVGKVKEESLKNLIYEYTKRLAKYCKLEIIEIEDEKLPATSNEKENEKIKSIECNKILEKLKKFSKSYIIALDINAKQYTSLEFAEKIENISTYHSSTIVFVIGGSLGLNLDILNNVNEKISFSKMTFPHQLFRLFLLEQIFRGFKINNNETYHH